MIDTLGDLEEILAYYYLEASPRTVAAVERRIVGEIESLPTGRPGTNGRSAFAKPQPARWRSSESRATLNVHGY